MISRLKNRIVLMTFIFLAIFFILSSTGILDILINGISYFANNPHKFPTSVSHPLESQYSIELDLSDLASNLGKELYNDGNHKIYVSYIEKGTLSSGGYIVGFRSVGKYSLHTATLISGVNHTSDDEGFSSTISARAFASYKGVLYESRWSGYTGLNYRDGDYFSFYIFPSDAYISSDVSLDEEGIVNFTVTNLYQHIWQKR